MIQQDIHRYSLYSQKFLIILCIVLLKKYHTKLVILSYISGAQ